MSEKHKEMSNLEKDRGFAIIALLLVISVVILLVCSNPPLEQHQEEVLKVATQEASKHYGTLGSLLCMPSSDGAMTALHLKRLTLGVCSIGYGDGPNNISVISFGVLGVVIAFAQS